MTSTPPSFQSFLSEHLATGRRLSFYQGALQKCHMFAGLCAPFCSIILIGWLYSTLSQSWRMGPMACAAVALLTVGVSSITISQSYKYFWKKWSEKHGYVFDEETSFLKSPLSSMNAEHLNRVHQLFTQLPGSINNMLLEKQLRNLKKNNRLPQQWWDELEKHLHGQLKMERVDVEAPHADTHTKVSLLDVWNTKSIAKEK